MSKGRYAWLMAGRTALLSASILFAVLAATIAILASWMNVRGMGMGPVYGMGAPLMLLLAFYLFKKGRKVERVVPITKRTTSTLPPEESLVRASNLPPSQQQAELLRAAQHGKETPSEELLRATITNGKGEA